jgi:hypothetical protein
MVEPWAGKKKWMAQIEPIARAFCKKSVSIRQDPRPVWQFLLSPLNGFPNP